MGSSWWSTAATSVTNVINENLGDGADSNGMAPKLYNSENIKQEKKRMPSLSSDQYFEKKERKESDILGMNESKNGNSKPLPFVAKSKKKEIKISNEDDFDEWGFGDDEEDNEEIVDKVETLLDFEKNKKEKQEIKIDPFFNEIDLDSNEETNTKSEEKPKEEIPNLMDKKNAGNNEDDDEWGW